MKPCRRCGGPKTDVVPRQQMCNSCLASCPTCSGPSGSAYSEECSSCRQARENARYASDPDWRGRRIAVAKDYYSRHRDEVATRAAEYQRRPEVREKERARGMRRYEAFRAKWVALLGGQCVECGSTEDLQFDHVDWREKSFNVSIRWNHRGVDQEMSKCQLLCVTHHRLKTVGDMRSMRQLGSPSSKTSSASNSSPGSGTSSTT